MSTAGRMATRVTEADDSVSSSEFVSHIPLFESLSEADRAVLAGLWHERTLRRGDKLFRKGDVGSSMFVIEEGIIEAARNGSLAGYPVTDIDVKLIRIQIGSSRLA